MSFSRRWFVNHCPWKPPVWAPWSYINTWRLAFSILALCTKTDKGWDWDKIQDNQECSTCWWLGFFFFFPFSWIFHQHLTYLQCSSGEFLLGRAEKIKILTLRWKSLFGHVNTAQSDVGIQLGINGTEQKVFPKSERICIAVELLHFFPKYVRQSSNR